jgi:hypothetical protein
VLTKVDTEYQLINYLLLNNAMEQRADSRSGGQEIPRFLWNPKVHYGFQ